MNITDVPRLLKLRQGNRLQKDLAAEIGISPQYLVDILRGRRVPGPRVLAYLGIEKREIYIHVRRQA